MVRKQLSPVHSAALVLLSKGSNPLQSHSQTKAFLAVLSLERWQANCMYTKQCDLISPLTAPCTLPSGVWGSAPAHPPTGWMPLPTQQEKTEISEFHQLKQRTAVECRLNSVSQKCLYVCAHSSRVCRQNMSTLEHLPNTRIIVRHTTPSPHDTRFAVHPSRKERV